MQVPLGLVGIIDLVTEVDQAFLGGGNMDMVDQGPAIMGQWNRFPACWGCLIETQPGWPWGGYGNSGCSKLTF